MYNGITLLRAIAAFFIVGCHLQLTPRTVAGEWMTSFCNMNVGLFGAISGFLMSNTFLRNDQDFDQYDYIRKRLRRLFPAYAFWSIFYLLASVAFAIVLRGGIEQDKYMSPEFWYSVLLWGGSSCHLWFLASLFYVQVFVAFCRPMRTNAFLNFIVAIPFIWASTLSRSFYLLYPCRLFGFVLFGMSLRTFFEQHRIDKKTSWLLLVLGIAFHILGRPHIHPFMRDAVAVGALLLTFGDSTIKLFGDRISMFMARCSMGVYLVHPFYAAGFDAICKKVFTPPYNAVLILVDWLTLYLISLVTTYLMLRVPSLRKFVS